MNASIDRSGWGGRQADARSAREALDALVSGASDQEAFLRTIGALRQSAPDTVWETLALLDQYYRLGKVAPAAFQTLKSDLERQGLETQENGRSPVHASTSARVAAPPLEAKRGAARSVGGPPTRHPRPPTARTVDRTGAHRPGVVKPSAIASRETPAASARVAVHGGSTTVVAGDTLRGRYRLVRLLGEGSGGAVFEASDRQRADLPGGSQNLAIKLVAAAEGRRPDPVEGLRREFLQLQSLAHPHVVRAFDFDREGDVAFFTMELLSGVPLSRVLAAQGGRPLPRAWALSIIRDVGSALAHAHSRNVVHGDISPQALLVTAEGELRIVDFGVSRRAQRSAWILPSELAQAAPVATPEYASCKVLQGDEADAQDDLYAFAGVAYLLLTGRHPFEGRTAAEARALRLRPARPKGLHRRAWQMLRAALGSERRQRPIGVAQLLQGFDLRAAAPRLPSLSVLVTPPPPRRRRWLLPIALGSALLLVTGLGLWFRGEHGVATPDFTRTGAVASRISTAAVGLLASLQHAGAEAAAVLGARVPRVPLSTAGTASASVPSAGSQARGVDAAVSGTASSAPSDVEVAAAAESAVPLLGSPVPPRAAANAVRGPVPAPAPAAKARIEFAETTVDVAPSDPLARVTVRRRGNLRGDVSFMWWTEPGTATSGEDFVAYAAHVEHIPDGKSGVALLVPVVSSHGRHGPKTFYVVMDQPSPGSVMGENSLAQVTLPATE